TTRVRYERGCVCVGGQGEMGVSVNVPCPVMHLLTLPSNWASVRYLVCVCVCVCVCVWRGGGSGLSIWKMQAVAWTLTIVSKSVHKYITCFFSLSHTHTQRNIVS